MSGINEARDVSWHESCEGKCRLDASFGMINKDRIIINADVIVKS